jgi:periplasmic copper chaperone A
MKCTALLFALISLAVSPAVAETYTTGSIEVSNPWMRATPRGADVAGAYMTVVNNGTEPDRLIGGSIAGVNRFEIHRMEMVGEVSKMRPVADGLEIKPGQSVTLTPSSFHVMLMGLKQPFQEGQHVKGTVTFQKAGKLDVEFTVESIGATGPMPSMPGGTLPAH